jgi:hypothetical protein
MPRVVAPTLAVVASGLIVAAALLPEFEAAGVAVVPLDSERPGWLPILAGTLAQVGLVLMAAATLFLNGNRAIAGGILLGAGILGLMLRLVRLFQLAEVAELSPAMGSWVDLVAEAGVIGSGALALVGIGQPEADEEAADIDLAPPPGDRPQAAP